MWFALSPIVTSLAGVRRRLKAAALNWLVQTERDAVTSLPWHGSASLHAANKSKATATVLPFPIRGEALLVKLATHLKAVVEKDRRGRSPFLFAITHMPQARLLIDEMAHAEFDVARGEFRIQVLVAPDTRITAETSDFDVMVDFIAQYMRGRLVETSALEVAS
jgi:hypothetical protein